MFYARARSVVVGVYLQHLQCLMETYRHMVVLRHLAFRNTLRRHIHHDLGGESLEDSNITRSSQSSIASPPSITITDDDHHPLIR
jgi:hypothetical protein